MEEFKIDKNEILEMAKALPSPVPDGPNGRPVKDGVITPNALQDYFDECDTLFLHRYGITMYDTPFELDDMIDYLGDETPEQFVQNYADKIGMTRIDI